MHRRAITPLLCHHRMLPAWTPRMKDQKEIADDSRPDPCPILYRLRIGLRSRGGGGQTLVNRGRRGATKDGMGTHQTRTASWTGSMTDPRRTPAREGGRTASMTRHRGIGLDRWNACRGEGNACRVQPSGRLNLWMILPEGDCVCDLDLSCTGTGRQTLAAYRLRAGWSA